MKSLRLAIEDYLYELDALDLTMAAAEALARGVDSPALAELAGLSKNSAYEIREIVPQVIEELAIEVSPFPEAAFRRAADTARSYLAGDLDFRTAARRVTDLVFHTGYVDFDERPDIGLGILDDLTLLNEWVYAVDNGPEEYGWYYFESSKDAEASFRSVASALSAASV
ncbi:hypothetical protein AB0B28_08755 [Glycomyces sp. NPDC046736]|uniref:hypothetical protein n=1 Tax=Glycomyces sp. NPDC046736 TaxID=3155615 RepID=UPI0033C19EDA